MNKFLISTMAIAIAMSSCDGGKGQETEAPFDYSVDKFADIEVLRYRVPGFEELPLQQKELIYYLSEAALVGRDILWDQNGKYNLAIRKTLEGIYTNYSGDTTTADYKGFVDYLKQVWFSNGIYHHYSMDKFSPKFSKEFFVEQVKAVPAEQLPLAAGQTVEALIEELSPVIFDPTVLAKRVNQAAGVDLIQTSANNYYDGVTQKEVEQFYAKMKVPGDTTPISYGLNSKLVKRNGKIYEDVYKVGGLYSPAIEKNV